MKKLAILTFVLSFSIPACSFFTQPIVAPEKINKFSIDDYNQGFIAGYETAKQEIINSITSDIETYKQLQTYKQLVYHNAVKPPEIIVVHTPAKISKDGQTYTSPKIEYKIVSPAKFVNPDIITALASEYTTYSAGTFDTLKDAQNIQENLKNKIHPNDTLTIIHTSDDRYSVIIKATSGTDYSNIGLIPLKKKE